MSLDGMVMLGHDVAHSELDPVERTEARALAGLRRRLEDRGQWPVECSMRWSAYVDPADGTTRRTCTVSTLVPALPEDER